MEVCMPQVINIESCNATVLTGTHGSLQNALQYVSQLSYGALPYRMSTLPSSDPYRLTAEDLQIGMVRSSQQCDCFARVLSHAVLAVQSSRTANWQGL